MWNQNGNLEKKFRKNFRLENFQKFQTSFKALLCPSKSFHFAVCIGSISNVFLSDPMISLSVDKLYFFWTMTYIL